MKKKFSSIKNKSISNFNNYKNNIYKININSSIRSQYNPRKTISLINEEVIYYDKSQKEILLNLIKNSQLNIIIQMSKIDCKNKINTIKDFLKDLKGFLAYLLNEKIKNKDNLQIKVNMKKERLQKEISNKSKYGEGVKDSNNKIKTRIKSIRKVIDTEMVEKNYVGSELSKLRLQTFKTENEIIKTEFSILKLRRSLTYLKSTIIFPEDNREIICYNNLNQEKIDDVFNGKIQIKKNKLENIRKKIQKKREEQEQYIKAINKIKCDIITRNNILEKDIIYELSIENRIISNS